MARYSLYEIIKPNLSPTTRKKLEEKMAYEELQEIKEGEL